MKIDYKKTLDGITEFFPDKFIGFEASMKKYFRAVNLSTDPQYLIDKTRNRTVLYYIILFCVLLLVLSQSIINLCTDKSLSSFEREDWSGSVKQVEAEVRADFKGESVKRQATIAVRPRPPSEPEIRIAMASLRNRLPKLILGNNGSLYRITEDMRLITKDENTGAKITWSSDREELITENGSVNLLAGQAGEDVYLTANIQLGNAVEQISMRAVLAEPGETHVYSKDLGRSLQYMISEISNSTDGEVLSLPVKTNTGVKLSWKKQRDLGYLLLPPLIILFIFLVYRGRYIPIKNEVRRQRSEMKHDFPDFLAKLLLLLNAGLVVSSAVARIAEDYEQRKRPGEERPFYEELLEIKTRMKASGTTLVTEFSELAIRSDQREIMRFSAILSDNIDKGAKLSEKLAREEHTIRLLKKRSVEERARVAETKLTFPMSLELFSVIMITAAPAVMQMNS